MIKIGDKIKPIDDTGEFTVCHIIGSNILALDEHGFEHQFSAQEIVAIKQDWIKNVTVEGLKKDEKPKTKSVKSKSSQKQKRVLEIDLHAGVLLGSTRGLSNHEILTEQLNAVKAGINQARSEGYQVVIFIHGKGKGRLKEELYKLLQRLDKISFYDAEFRRYSLGATEVKLH